ncbi:YraN family protein [Flagellimonas sp.]|uniref:YraN family protein n=1 Tax=Flagellimonas sp. TaxID=2058762 RepID=UPI003B5BB421
MGKHNEFGKQGEQIAVDFLRKAGYKICLRNYRYLKAEIDIIAKMGETLAIVEVKTRTSDFLEDMESVINPKKIKLLTLAADQYVQEHDLDIDVRFDVIIVIKRREGFEVEHLENAFYHF